MLHQFCHLFHVTCYILNRFPLKTAFESFFVLICATFRKNVFFPLCQYYISSSQLIPFMIYIIYTVGYHSSCFCPLFCNNENVDAHFSSLFGFHLCQRNPLSCELIRIILVHIALTAWMIWQSCSLY